MPINPLIALQGQNIDVGSTYSNALLGLSRQQQLEEARALEPIKQKLLEAQASQAQSQVPTAQQQFNEQDKRFISSVATISSKIIPDLKAGNTEGVRAALNDRISALQSAGLPTDNTERALSLLDTNPDDLLAKSVQAVELDKRINQPESGRVSTRAFAPVTLVNPDTKEKMLVTPTFNPNTNIAELSEFDIPEGFEVSKETPEEERAADVLAKGQEEGIKVTSKGQAARRQNQIDNGIDAADATANIRRALDLIGQVPTGGVDAVSLKAKQLFGVEGADEAELSSRLGKAVLSQLRATFGAAFTEREGARLASIEAGFGKSTAGNKRLLDQTLKILNRSAQRGIRAAESAGDKAAAQDIREALEFVLEDEPTVILPKGVSEEDIAETMRANKMTREQVLQRLGNQ